MDQKVCPHNNLQVLCPEIANEWSDRNQKQKFGGNAPII